MDSTIPRLWLADPTIKREDLYTFQDEAVRCFSGELKRSEFIAQASRFGCIPSAQTDTLLYHVPVPGGNLTSQLAQFISDAVKKLEVPRISLTQAPGIVLHELQIQPLCELLDQAFELGLLPCPDAPQAGEPEKSEGSAKAGDGGSITHPRVREQSQKGLYRVYDHPIGGYMDPGEFCRLLEAVQSIDGARIKLSCEQEMWICNLTSDEAEQILNMTGSSGQTPFERSVLAVIEGIDEPEPVSKEMLEDSIRAVYRAQIPEEALPRLLITDNLNRALAESALVHSDQEDDWPEGSLLVLQDWENDEAYCTIYLMPDKKSAAAPQKIARIGNEQLPLFFTALGRHVAGSGMDYVSWYEKNPEELAQFAVKGVFTPEKHA